MHIIFRSNLFINIKSSLLLVCLRLAPDEPFIIFHNIDKTSLGTKRLRQRHFCITFARKQNENFTFCWMDVEE